METVEGAGAEAGTGAGAGAGAGGGTIDTLYVTFAVV